jgi:cytochrome d ubiquinol oxidase subunit I
LYKLSDCFFSGAYFAVLMSMTFYPVNDFGPVMKGLVIGGLGIFHVFLAQFAIGGGLLLCYFQWLAHTRRLPEARRLVSSYFKVIVLVSFVMGALTGVGMWFTSIQLSPRTIGLMVDEFHWLWATEWTFFCVEIAAGYAFYRYYERLTDRTRMALLVTYTFAGWMSLFWINGILSWQLTPGHWIAAHNVWAGFFNPSFWPSLFYRTISSMTIAALVACVVINALPNTREEKTRLINHAAHLLWPVVLMPVFGLWYVATMPADSRSWILGGSIAMTLFLNLTVGASAIIGLYAVAGLLRKKLYINGATAAVLTALAFGATAGGEFVREGSRKPYTVRDVLYSNSLTPAEVTRLRETGSVHEDPYPILLASKIPNAQIETGAKVFRAQCSICHTPTGVNGLTHLASSWSTDQKRMNIAKLQLTKTFMPPFAGPPEELEALVQYIEWVGAGEPANWPLSQDPAVRERIATWLREAGTESSQAHHAHAARNGDPR